MVEFAPHGANKRDAAVGSVPQFVKKALLRSNKNTPRGMGGVCPARDQPETVILRVGL